MPKIKDNIEQRIKDAAKVTDVIQDAGYTLHRQGSAYKCLCPFHDDRHIGSFIVNERKNYYKCFSCGAKGDAIKFVQEYHHLEYRDALLYIAAMYNIYVEEDEHYEQMRAKREEYKKTFVPREPLPPTKMVYWNAEIVKPYLHHEDANNLLRWMLSLPMRDEHRRNLKNAIQLYLVGTSMKGYTAGWTVFPQVDDQMRLRDMKLMAYKPDGHREKRADGTGKANWMRAMLEKAGKFDPDTQHVEHCLFGLHLAPMFPKAEICLVESEKSAVLCAAFTDPNERLWMATGGMQFFKPDMLAPLIRAKRDIVLYPDYDGYEAWEEAAKVIDYPRMSISQKPRELHIMADGPKADIADIMVRTMQGITESTAEIAARRLGLKSVPAGLAMLIEKLDMKIED